MVDWPAHYNTIYPLLGVSAELSIVGVDGTDGSDGDEITLTVIEKTGDDKIGQWLGVDTVRPLCAVRVAELIDAGGDFDDLDDSEISYNGKTYRIESHRVKPSPTGEDTGEVYLVMTEVS